MEKPMSFVRRLAVTLFVALLAIAPAKATVNSTVNKTIALGDGVTTQFQFAFIGVAAAYISVILTDASGNETVLTQGANSSQYQIALNAPVTGAIWGIGGTVTYNPGGTPIPSGSTLTIFRTLPLTQAISLQRMNSLSALGNGAETGLDTGTMQLQQVSENIARAIVAPIVDATPPAPLPPIAQRANKGAAFDAEGNLVAGTTPSSGVISSAMQPVVSAATLALGRTAFGLGNLATGNIGAGLQSDGAGGVRVNSQILEIAVNQSITTADHLKTYAASGTLTFALSRANTMFAGFTIKVLALTGTITFTPDANDSFFGQASGASLLIPKGAVATISTNAATSGTWYADVTGVSPVVNIRAFTAVGSSTYTPTAGLLYADVVCVGGGGGGGGASSSAGNAAAGGGGGAGGYARRILTAAQIGASKTVVVGAGGAAGTSGGGSGGTGGSSSLGGTLCAVSGGQGGLGAVGATAGDGGSGGDLVAGDFGAPGAPGMVGLGGSSTLYGATGGTGGSSFFGGGGRGNTTGGATVGIQGQRGGGGGGGASVAALANAGGGAGGVGSVVITEYVAFAQ